MNHLVIAGDAETGEEYLARIVDDRAHGHDPPPRPIVEVLRVVRYPNQRAIADQDVPMEFPAIGAGTLCRLDVIREPAEEERALFARSPEEAMALAIQRAMEEARNDGERAILSRHAAGEFGRRRLIVAFLPSDIEYLQRYTATVHKEEKNGLPEDMGELPGGH